MGATPSRFARARIVSAAAPAVSIRSSAAAGSYLTRPPLPYVPGSEVIGRTADGRRLMSVTEGGGYASKAVVPAALAVDVPDGVGDGEALALLAQGLTAWHLLRTCARLNPGESVVVNAAAGGVGTLTVQ